MDKFTAIFALSFQTYCKTNDLDIPDDEMIEKWKEQTVHSYKTSPNIDFIMNLFKIPKNKRKDVEYHEYSIKATGHEIDPEKKVLYIFLRLKLKK